MYCLSGSCSQEFPATGLLEQAILLRRICIVTQLAKGIVPHLLQGLCPPPEVSQRDFSAVIPYEHRIFSQLSNLHNAQQGKKLCKDNISSMHRHIP